MNKGADAKNSLRTSNRPGTSLKLLCLGLVAVTLGLRVAYVLLLPAPRLATDARDDYIPIAKNLLAGHGFIRESGEPDCVRGPVYPAFVAVMLGLSPHRLASVEWTQSLIDTGTVLVIFLVGIQVFKNSVAAWVGALLAALYPPGLLFCRHVTPDTLFAATFAVTVLLLLLTFRRDSTSIAFAAGASLGLSLLLRATMLAFPILAVLLFIFVPGLKGRGTKILLFLLGIILVVAPWTVRNYLESKELILITANGGTNIHAGSKEEFLTNTTQRFELRQQDYAESSIVRPNTPTPRQEERYLLAISLENYRELWQERGLWGLVRLTTVKLARLAYMTDSGKNQKPLLVMHLMWLGITIPGVLLAWHHWARRAEMVTILLPCLYLVALFAVMLPLARYVMPVVRMLSLFAGLTLCTITRKLIGLTRFGPQI